MRIRAAGVVAVVVAIVALAPVARAGARVPIVLYGDSLTTEAMPYVQGFASEVGGVDALVRGAPGGATCDLFERMGWDLRRGIRPAFVVLQFSGNNLTRCMQDADGRALHGDAWLAKYRADTVRAIRMLRPMGAPIWLATSPVSFLADRKGEDDVWRLAAMYEDLARRMPGVHVSYAGSAVLAAGRMWTRTMPCLPHEPCTQVDTNGQRANQVRAVDGTHFCPVPYANGGTCPVWSSGAMRFGVGLVLPGLRASGRLDPARFRRSWAAGWGA